MLPGLLSGIVGQASGGATLWTPADLSGVVARYTGDSIVHSGGSVSQWSDTIGTQHLVQGTGSARPAYVTGGAFGGAPHLLFDGVDDFMQAAGFALGSTDTLTLFAIMQVVTNVNGRYVAMYAGTSIRPQITELTAERIQLLGASGASSIATVGVATPRALITSWDRVAGNSIWFGSTLQDSDPAGADTAMASTANLTLGAFNSGTANSNIRIAELVVTNAIPSGAELAEWAAYASSTYGIT